MKRCIYCNTLIAKNFINLFNDNTFCIKCFANFNFINNTFDVLQPINDSKYVFKYHILFEYNEYAKDFLHFYKRKNNIILCTLFKDFLANYITETFNLDTSTFTYVSSTSLAYSKRGFIPTYELLKQVENIQIHKGPRRLDNLVQGKLSFDKRKVQKHSYRNTDIKANENLIIFDDVISTSTTVINYIKYIDNLDDFDNIFIVCLFGSKNFNPKNLC